MARLDGVKHVIQNPYGTLPPSGTPGVHVFEDVPATTDVAKVLLDTLVDPHPAVLRLLHHHHFVLVTPGGEIFGLAELGGAHCKKTMEKDKQEKKKRKKISREQANGGKKMSSQQEKP